MLIWIIKSRKYQYIVLLLASYFFYYYSSKTYILLFVISSLANFYFGLALFKSKKPKFKKFLLYSAIIFNIGMLGFFKYADFALIIVNDLSALTGHALNFSLLHIILPLGISFYTFEAISYVVDVYRGTFKAEKSLLHFLLFLAFFPKLIAGPIMRASEFLPQLKKKRIKIKAENVKVGITVILWGLFKKIVIADNVAFLVDAIFKDPTSFHSSLPIIIGAFSFGIQVYADFSGYCDIAIGTAKLFGFDLVQNFNRPYLSKNPSEFWRRWHMSLSLWIRDYIYTPVYVSISNKKRLNKIKNIYLKTTIAIYLATMVALFFMGIWHGAYWNFVIYGIYNGLLLVVYYFFSALYKKFKFTKSFLYKLRDIISIFITMYLMMFGFMMFRITNLKLLFFSLKQYTIFNFSQVAQDLNTIKQIIILRPGVVVAAVLFLCVYITYFFVSDLNIKERIKKLSFVSWMLVLVLAILIIIIMIPSKSGTFIYFQF